LRADASLLDSYQLDDRERRRLLAMVSHQGMSHNCTLYRANRLTPIGRGLPITCELLGERLSLELERFWTDQPDAEIQFRLEAQRFAVYLLRRLDSGAFADEPRLAEALTDVLARERRVLDQRLGPVLHP
jgi:hypothetical protein